MFLIIDTTGKKALVALGDKKGIISFGEWPNGNDLSKNLQPQIEKLLKLARRKPQAIFCVTGPGSFTSLRIGVASANALGYAWNIPVVGLTRFEIYEEKESPSKPFVTVLDNIRDLVYAKICRQEDCEYFVGDYKDLESWVKSDISLVGEIKSKEDLDSPKELENVERALPIMKRGEKLLYDMPSDEFSLPIKPLYINPPNITEPNKKS